MAKLNHHSEIIPHNKKPRGDVREEKKRVTAVTVVFKW